MTLKLRILRSLTRLFIILVSLTKSLFSEKMLISNRCICGLMSNLIKKSWTVSNMRTIHSTFIHTFFIQNTTLPLETVAAAIWISTFWKGIGKEIVWKMKGRMNKCNQMHTMGWKTLQIIMLIECNKVETTWEDSLDLIPSPAPSVKIQIIGGKVYRWQ